jgi:hypothetical protein
MDELSILEQAEKNQEKYLSLFMERMKLVAVYFLDSVSEVIDKLKMTPDSKMSDWKTVTRYRLNLRSALQSAGYDSAVRDLINGMSEVTLLIEGYYEPYGMAKHSSFFKSAGQQAIDRISAQLLDAVPEMGFIEPISQALENAVMQGQSLTDLKRQVREIIHTSELPANYVFNQAKQALWMFHRNYSGSIGTALGLDHFYYDGVALKHSRGFCLARKGKAFKKEDIEKWAMEEWQGKIPGTTKESIFWLCGGYNCIDVLRPITKELYDRFNKPNQ